jgi:hypothetical protein
MKQYTSEELTEITKRCKQYFKYRTARIVIPQDRMYLIVTVKKDYVHEMVIANGMTEEELIESIKRYVQICDITRKEYFKKLRKDKIRRKYETIHN